MVLSILSPAHRVNILSAGDRPGVRRNIKKLIPGSSDDPGSAIPGHFLTCTVSIPSVAVMEGVWSLRVPGVPLAIICPDFEPQCSIKLKSKTFISQLLMIKSEIRSYP